jgi:outer membrane murein-binding lipoprotein Lpp
LSQKESLAKEIKLLKEESKNLDSIYNEKESEEKHKINIEYKSKLKFLEAKLATERKELNSIIQKLDKDVKRIHHLNLSELRIKRAALNSSIKEITGQVKRLTKEREMHLNKKSEELRQEWKAASKNYAIRLKKLIKNYEKVKNY